MGAVRHVYIFANGMAVVFDALGHQIPELEGRWAEVREKILAVADGQTEFHGLQKPLEWPRS